MVLEFAIGSFDTDVISHQRRKVAENAGARVDVGQNTCRARNKTAIPFVQVLRQRAAILDGINRHNKRIVNGRIIRTNSDSYTVNGNGSDRSRSGVLGRCIAFRCRGRRR